MIRQFTSKTQQLGLLGEEKAAVFLMKQGFLLVDRNTHNRHGEIDIIATKAKTYYFFEVKTGKAGSWFNPAENLTKDKLWKLFRAVEYYSLKRGIKDYKIQAILVLLSPNDTYQASIETIDLT